MTKSIIALLLLSTASIAVLAAGTDAAEDASTPTQSAPSSGEKILTREMFTEDKVAPMVKPDKYDITIVEYTDYQCPFCRKVHPELKKLAQSDKRVRIIYRDWPIFGEASVIAARVAIASNYQGKHAAVHDALMNASRPLTDETIKAAALKAGVDWSRLEADMKKHGSEIDDLISRNSEQAEALGLQGTPAFIIGNYLSEGGMDYTALKSAVDKARKTPAPPLQPSPEPAGI